MVDPSNLVRFFERHAPTLHTMELGGACLADASADYKWSELFIKLHECLHLRDASFESVFMTTESTTMLFVMDKVRGFPGIRIHSALRYIFCGKLDTNDVGEKLDLDDLARVTFSDIDNSVRTLDDMLRDSEYSASDGYSVHSDLGLSESGNDTEHSESPDHSHNLPDSQQEAENFSDLSSSEDTAGLNEEARSSDSIFSEQSARTVDYPDSDDLLIADTFEGNEDSLPSEDHEDLPLSEYNEDSPPFEYYESTLPFDNYDFDNSSIIFSADSPRYDETSTQVEDMNDTNELSDVSVAVRYLSDLEGYEPISQDQDDDGYSADPEDYAPMGQDQDDLAMDRYPSDTEDYKSNGEGEHDGQYPSDPDTYEQSDQSGDDIEVSCPGAYIE